MAGETLKASFIPGCVSQEKLFHPWMDGIWNLAPRDHFQPARYADLGEVEQKRQTTDTAVNNFVRAFVSAENWKSMRFL